MLTEEMPGALLDALVGVQRLILVGDPQTAAHWTRPPFR